MIKNSILGMSRLLAGIPHTWIAITHALHLDQSKTPWMREASMDDSHQLQSAWRLKPFPILRSNHAGAANLAKLKALLLEYL